MAGSVNDGDHGNDGDDGHECVPVLVKFLKKQRMLSPFRRRGDRGVGKVRHLSRVVLLGPELQLQESSPSSPHQDPLVFP